MCRILLLWLQGTALPEDREDQDTVPLPQGAYDPVAFFSMLRGDLRGDHLSQTVLILYRASSVNLLEF